MNTADTMRAVLEALEIGRDAANSELVHRQDAYAGYPHKWAAEQEDLAKIDSALSLLRSALSDDALRRAGAAGPLGDPDVLASPLPNEVLQLLNHVTEPKSWGAQGYVQVLGTRDGPGGQAYYRAKWAEMEYVGRAEWVVADGVEGRKP